MKNKAYNKLKQRLKKYLAENGDGEMLYLTQLEKYKKDPQDSEEEEEDSEEEEKKAEEESSEEESEEEVKEKPKEPKKEQNEEDEEYDDEYYDEEDDAEGDKESDVEEVKIEADNDPKLRAKYPFLWKPLEEWKPSERRWKWVKKECLPLDLKDLLYPTDKPKNPEEPEISNIPHAPSV